MSLDTGAVETITVDSFTTIVDVDKSTREALAEYVDDPEPVATVDSGGASPDHRLPRRAP